MVRLKLLEIGSIDYCLDINFCIRPRILNHVTFYFHVYVGTLTGIAMDEFRYSRREFGPFSNYPEFKFKIWDFGGQEDFYTTHQCFLSTLALYLLVWNLQEGKQKKNRREKLVALTFFTRCFSYQQIVAFGYVDEIL